MATIKSAVKRLKPILAISEGKELSESELQSTLKSQSDYTTSEAQRIWNLNASILEPAIAATSSHSCGMESGSVRRRD